MITLWGPSQQKEQVAHGIYWVSTASHGGIIIGQKVARELLSEAAQKLGVPCGPWLCYEEDDLFAVPALEIPALRAHLYPDKPDDEVCDRLRKSLAYFHADYLREVAAG